ncbi:amidohydrolase [Paraglaciecola polaris]|uniref:5-methylthioadenosine/S-adenosylhomocysteine deaminase 2 n=1 Tax=Paraglaciecola polaris LMG 21857 TaxID=1129793 RepID=K6ZQ01_9ALTE|nr:amidohydrolase [Paraglaciecola polaris]GAC30948.1 5-methylthioadenosine/S-adenosylhomocysteine deaminase 2 [Paraglaciecola polaris LMG 21857]|tara:strand:- start:654 stop:2066 length:1413 start_codon:yes stop_codon:yes gene_type:complete
MKLNCILKTILSFLLFFGFSSILNAQQTVDILITNGHILTMDSGLTEYPNGFLAIKDNKIIEIGPHSKTQLFTATKVLDVEGDLVLPGFINTHTHVSMTLFRSLGDDVEDRLHGYIFPLEKEFVSREMVYLGAELGNLEMLKGGVTTYADMYYFEDEVAKAVDQIGMRAVLGQTVIKYPQADAKTAEEGIAYAEKFIKKYKNHPRITPAFAPHGPYTNTTETLQKIAELSLKYDVPVLTHLAESKKEQDVIAQRSNGLSPIAYLESIGVLNKNLVGAHVILANEQDIAILKKYHVGVAHNLSANIKAAKGVAPVVEMLKQGVDVGLGTDGPMSGNTISLMDEFSQVAKVQKQWNKDRSLMPAVEVIKMATMGSANVLNQGDSIGSLEVGKLADIIVIGTKSANMTPIYNPYSAIVYSAYATDVRHSIVDGKLLMEDRKALTIDEDDVIKRAYEFSLKVKQALISQGKPIL